MLMKKIFFVCLYLLLISPLKAQKDVANKVLWSKNGLMWSHFEAKPEKHCLISQVCLTVKSGSAVF